MANDAKLAVARDLIKEKHYDAARAVLKTIPTNSTAQIWLAKLNEIAPEEPGAVSSKRNSSGLVIDVVATFILILIAALVWTNRGSLGVMAAIVPTATATHLPTNTPTETSTFTPSPTNTPVPTATLSPTWTPAPTQTPFPTATFEPTVTSIPTIIQVPLHLSSQSSNPLSEVDVNNPAVKNWLQQTAQAVKDTDYYTMGYISSTVSPYDMNDSFLILWIVERNLNKDKICLCGVMYTQPDFDRGWLEARK